MAGLVLVEGLPGTGKSTTLGLLGQRAAAAGVPVRCFEEGRPDHPVDFEQVALLSADALLQLSQTGADSAVARAVERYEGYALLRDRERADWPEDLRAALARHDAYDGAQIGPDLHRRALLDSWRRFGAAAAREPWTYVVECVLLQNPVTALLGRFDLPEDVVEQHVHQRADAVADLDPLLVYLDAGDPEAVLAAAAAERPAAWLDFVIRYHTEQGYGLARGLHGFDGLVEFMRVRRQLELALLESLPVRTCVVDVARTSPAEREQRIAAALGW
ncbi:MAG: hypothetical protein ACTHOD_11820 [Motilibacteraceae bacterium]